MFSTKNPSDKYQRLSLATAQANPSFYQLFENMYREQAARWIQRKWRGAEAKTERKYAETLTGPFSLRFIQEPWGLKKPLEHAEKINTGKQETLDFNDPEFVRHIYKALRLRYITTNQMVDALLLHGMNHFFHNPIKRCTYEEKNIFAAEINFATQEHEKEFAAKLQNIPEHERCYFQVNLPKKYATAFLFNALVESKDEPFEQQFILLYPKIRHMFYNYISQLTLSVDKKNELKGQVDCLTHSAKYKNACGYLIAFLITDADKESNNIAFLAALLRVAEDMPALEISPDFDEKNPASPLLCFNLATTTVMNELHHVLFKKKETIKEFFTVGQISTRMMRALDEKKEAARPVELTHPNIAKHPTYHNYDATDFMATWHDRFHRWKCSINDYKKFFRFLIQLEEKVTGFDMSKSIWALTDRDNRSSYEIKMAEKKKDKASAISSRGTAIWSMLYMIGNNFWDETAKHDLNLMYMADMISHYSVWHTLLKSTHPRQIFTHSSYSDFLKCYKEMEVIVKLYPNNSIPFYILAYRLKDLLEGPGLCKELSEINIANVLYWKKDKGLYICRKDKAFKDDKIKEVEGDFAIEKMKDTELYDLLFLIKENLKIKTIPHGFFAASGLQRPKILHYGTNEIEEAIIHANLRRALDAGLTTEKEIHQLKRIKFTLKAVLSKQIGLIALQKKFFTLTDVDSISGYQFYKLLTKEGMTAFENGMTFKKAQACFSLDETIKEYTAKPHTLRLA